MINNNHPNRRRILCAPLSTNQNHGLLRLLPSRLEPLAFVIGSEPLAPHGLLVRVRHNGNLAIWRGCRIEQVDRRKADAALATLEPKTA